MTPIFDRIGIEMVLTAEQESFLAEHQLAVLGTGRADGSPQLSHIVYDYDGRDIAISVKRYTAKWKNILRQPRICLLIHDGRKQLVLYGKAETIDEDPERLELTLRVMRRLANAPSIGRENPEQLVPVFDEQQRTALRIRPEKAFMND